jgi:hypothetical protein
MRKCLLITAALVAALAVSAVSGTAVTARAASATADPTITNYTSPSISAPIGITSGPDGALWFTNSNSTIGRITTSGAVTNYTSTTISVPRGITSGPDGALWFTNSGNNSIGRITTSGTVTNYTGTGISGPYGITTGPDGALWFTNDGNDSIGRITTAGAVTNYTGTGISNPWGITSGPDGALWFTNYGNNTIGRITTPPAATTATTVTTSLSGDGQSGTSIRVPASQAVTDTATLSGTNASTATGTVTYQVYSDSACTVAVNAGTAEEITTPGTLPASSPVTLSTAGTYYWQASYSGDANNEPSTSTCGTAGEVETVAPSSCGGAAGYNTPSSWTTQKVNTLTPGVDPLNVIITSCSNVSLADIQKGMSGWDSANACVSGERANVTGTFLSQQQSWRLDGCLGGGYDLALTGAENHARLWNQPITGSRYGAWFISASYETACVDARDTMVPVRDTDLDEAEYLILSAAGIGWHCIDGSQGSIGADGYDRAAQDFVAAIQAAAVSQKWDVSVQTIQTPAGTGEGHVTRGGSAAQNAIAEFDGTVYVVTVDSATSTP